MTDDTYNGHPNWDTWNANLHLSNDYDTYQLCIKALLNWNPATPARDVLQPILRDCIPCSDGRRDGKAWDGIDFDAVDWLHVADCFAPDIVEADA